MTNKHRKRHFTKSGEQVVRIKSSSKVAFGIAPTPEIYLDDNTVILTDTEDMAILIVSAVRKQIVDAGRDYKSYLIEWGDDSDGRPAVQLQKTVGQ